MYSRAVWREAKWEEERTVPSNWINDETKQVRWPTGVNAVKAYKTCAEPQENWKTFSLLKEKFSAGMLSFIFLWIYSLMQD